MFLHKRTDHRLTTPKEGEKNCRNFFGWWPRIKVMPNEV